MLLQAIDKDPRYSRSDYTAKFREFLLDRCHLATGEKKRSKWIVCKQGYRPNIQKFFKGDLGGGVLDPCGASTYFPTDYMDIVANICTLSALKEATSTRPKPEGLDVAEIDDSRPKH
jgi:hypothetical protein